jgi:CheY-like chemotaxis protein
MGEGQLVLVADDELTVQEMIKLLLESNGYKVIVANDGREAVVLYTKRIEKIRLVLTDMRMPYMDGTATIRALR